MTVTNRALPDINLMPKQLNDSVDLRRQPALAAMKSRQSAKIREIMDALISVGFETLDAQAAALGLSRSTTWTLRKDNHKTTGLSAKIIGRMLAGRRLPPLVRAKILEYIEEKASGYYGHSAIVRRKFITALSIYRAQQAKKLQTVMSGKAVRIMAHARPRATVGISKRNDLPLKPQQSSRSR